MRQGIPHEVHPATLPGCLEHLGHGCLDPLVAVADDQLHTPQTPAVQAAQELRPERLGLAGTHFEAKHLALAFGIDPNRHYHRHAHDAPGLAGLHIGGIHPQVGPVTFDRAAQEGAHTLVEFTAQARDLALGDAGHPQRLDQVVHRAGGDALDVGFLDDGGQRFLGGAPGLQEFREVGA